jgi:phosphatidylinositol-3-phosphatase
MASHGGPAKKLLALLIVETLAILWFLAVPSAAANSISLNQPAYLGATVTFTVSSPTTGSINPKCYQGTTFVWGTNQKANTSFLLGGTSSQWKQRGGAASCTAEWYQIKNGVRTTLATTSFQAAATSPTPTPTPTETPTPTVTETPSPTETPTPTVTSTSTPPPASAPIVLVLLENTPFSAIAGFAPWLNATAAQGRLFTNYVALTHPSLPNYIAFTSGGFQGCTSDSICKANTLTAPSFYGQLEQAGISWASYAESMPTNCQGTDSGVKPNRYIAHHQPVVYFTDVHQACLTKSVPLTQLNPAALPAFSFIVPTNAHNMHDGTILESDDWLRTNLQPLIDAGAEVIVTADEGKAANQYVYTVAVGPGITPSTNATRYDHYSLLAGLQDHFGLPRLGSAQTAVPLPI